MVTLGALAVRFSFGAAIARPVSNHVFDIAVPLLPIPVCRAAAPRWNDASGSAVRAPR
ncbi:hypothetical protein [Paraburkholderia solisilvae]|uniref:Uncharacterized protein n=1 Tax=Paraburkholderia solisilvae TaxID=624376 RepID=A0A6J5EA03_9BURK|nr:hypothetical protein [Paraburkholderia solisilvae]CAB3762156.1 hypothetical protein LMG29739_03805 [Paraburkholderia solisilvae]